MPRVLGHPGATNRSATACEPRRRTTRPHRVDAWGAKSAFREEKHQLGPEGGCSKKRQVLPTPILGDAVGPTWSHTDLRRTSMFRGGRGWRRRAEGPSEDHLETSRENVPMEMTTPSVLPKTRQDFHVRKHVKVSQSLPRASLSRCASLQGETSQFQLHPATERRSFSIPREITWEGHTLTQTNMATNTAHLEDDVAKHHSAL